MRGDPREALELPLREAERDPIAVVIKARAMILAEVDERDRVGIPLKDPIGLFSGPFDPHAIWALMEHIKVGAEVEALGEDCARVAETKDIERGGPERRPHEEVRRSAIVVGVARLLAGREAPGAPEGDPRDLLHEVIRGRINDLRRPLLTASQLFEENDAVVFLVDHPELTGAIWIKV